MEHVRYLIDNSKRKNLIIKIMKKENHIENKKRNN